MSPPFPSFDSAVRPEEASSRPLVSVIIPTYNRAEYVSEALDSAVRQTYPHLDIVVADNASSEEAFANIRAIVDGANDPRVRLLRRERNLGILQNNVQAMRSAPGTYVANLHDDDVWEPQFVEKLVSGLEANPGTTMAFCDHYLIDTSGQILAQATTQNTKEWNREDMETGVYEPFYSEALVSRSIPAVMGAIYRKDAIDWNDFPGEAKLAYDLWLAYLASRDGKGAYYVDERLTRYRTHQNTITAKQVYPLYQDLVYCYRQFLVDDQLESIRPGLNRWYNQYQVDIGLYLLSNEQRVEARECFWEAWQVAPSGRTVSGLVLSTLPTRVSTTLLRWIRGVSALSKRFPALSG